MYSNAESPRRYFVDQLDFRLRCDFSYDTRYFGFYTRLTGGNVEIY